MPCSTRLRNSAQPPRFRHEAFVSLAVGAVLESRTLQLPQSGGALGALRQQVPDDQAVLGGGRAAPQKTVEKIGRWMFERLCHVGCLSKSAKKGRALGLSPAPRPNGG